jgi:hypothetical protein
MTTSTPPIDLALEALPSVVLLVVIHFSPFSRHPRAMVAPLRPPRPFAVVRAGARKTHELGLYFECGLGFPKETEVDEELTKERK